MKMTKQNIGVKYGLISGIIIVLITFLLYKGGLDMYMGPLRNVIYLIVTTMAVLAALRIRKENEGFIEFSDALKITFSVFAIALLLHSIFNYILFSFIDPQFEQAVVEKSEQVLKKLAETNPKFNDLLKDQQSKNTYGISGVILGYAMSCIFAFIFCLLISLIIRKSKPAFNNI